MTRRRHTLWTTGCLLVLSITAPAEADHPTVGFAEGGGGPINTIPATTLPKGLWSLSLRLEYIDLDRFSDSRLRSFGLRGIETDCTDFTFSTFLSGAYGITDDFTVGARIPYVFRDDIREPELEDGEVEVENEGDSAGHGDMTLFGQYRFLKLEQENFELAAIAGLKFPTGFTGDRTREGGRFEVEHQPGSGSWDPLAGLAASKRWGRFSLHSNVLYSFVTEGSQNTNLGDLLGYNVGLVYQVGGPDPHKHEHQMTEDHHHASGLTWDLIAEINGEWREKIEIDGERDDNSGGHALFFSPGVRANLGERWSVFASISVPIHQDLNGRQHETDFRVASGVSLGF